jgi:uncharacterized protein (UPF0335 family)
MNTIDPLSEIRDLIHRISSQEDKLGENEQEIFQELSQKYAGPCEVGYDDKILLEVILRNIAVRQEMNMV